MNIRWKVLILGFGLVLLTTVLLGGAVSWIITSQSEKDISIFEKDILEKRKQELKNMMNTAYTALEAAYKDAQNEEKIRASVEEKLKASLDVLYSLIETRYQQALAAEDPDTALLHAKEELKDQIRKLRFGPNSKDYIWIHSFDAANPANITMLMHPTVPALDGRNISDYKYSSGDRKGQVVYATGIDEKVPFFQQMNRVVAEGEKGFVGYEWPKPTDEGLTEHQPKISYVRLFKPWGWVIGTGAYLSNVEARVQQEIAGVIGSLRYGPQKKDYFWIHSFDPKNPADSRMLMHPIAPALNGKDLSQYKYSSGDRKGQVVYATGIDEKVPFFQQMNRVVAENGEGFVGYEWPKPTDNGLTEHQPKISYVTLFKPWGWVIGTGVYLDEIAKAKKAKKDALQEAIESVIFAMLAVAAVVILLSLIIILFITNLITKPIHENIRFLKYIAEGKGDLTRRLAVDANDEVSELSKWFNVFIEQIQNIVKQIAHSADVINKDSVALTESVEQVSSTMHNLTQLATDQSASIEETAAAAREIHSGVEMTANYAQDADKSSKEADDESKEGSKAVAKMQTSMRRIQETATEIDNFIEAINEIANQTNLLSLNAAIEAAKAGEQGKGFAVVADEVRRLAENSAKVTQEIQNLIQESNQRISDGQEAVQMVETSLQRISKKITDSSELVSHISGATSEQNVALQEINETLEKLADSSAEIAEAATSIDEMTKQQSQSTQHSTDQAHELLEQIKKFKY
ncbi:MAG: methyl-accepting chemotaxis protein [SAR324 cluster bacterium]|nr:methyl-accepting chemotaxis protein [SAR324 cluster bacterium]